MVRLQSVVYCTSQTEQDSDHWCYVQLMDSEGEGWVPAAYVQVSSVRSASVCTSASREVLQAVPAEHGLASYLTGLRLTLWPLSSEHDQRRLDIVRRVPRHVAPRICAAGLAHGRQPDV
jgi:hypothetical protein